MLATLLEMETLAQERQRVTLELLARSREMALLNEDSPRERIAAALLALAARLAPPSQARVARS